MSADAVTKNKTIKLKQCFFFIILQDSTQIQKLCCLLQTHSELIYHWSICKHLDETFEGEECGENYVKVMQALIVFITHPFVLLRKTDGMIHIK